MSSLVIKNANTLIEALRGSINLFLGAGFSVHARNKQGKNLPAGNALRDQLVAAFGRSDLKDLPLAKVCTILESSSRATLDQKLTEVFTVNTFDPKYSSITRLNLGAVFTTNIDNLVPEIFKGSDKYYLNDVIQRGPAFSDRAAVDYIPLHGNILHSEGFTFNPVAIASAFSSDRDRWHYLTQRLQKAATIFCGYGLEDAGVLEALNPATVAGREHQGKWILLREQDAAAEAYFTALGFNLIVGDILDLLVWLDEHVPAGGSSGVPTATRKHPVLAEYLIPDPSTVPVRPIRDFYSGTAPSWDDIFSKRIFKTTHFSTIVDLILGRKNVVVLGLFASGKTTLMMQIASDLVVDSIKLVCSSMSLGKAELMMRALDSARALVFMDDLADNVDTFNYLAEQPNVQIVGFERNYSYDIVSHLVSVKRLSIYECTDLTPEDLQGLYDTLPKEMRIQRLRVPRTMYGIPPSLFEVIESNMVKPRVNERFGPVLKELEAKSQTKHDFLVFCCYVHDCRTPVSLDMALAFLRGLVKNYTEAYELIEGLDALVVSSYDLTIDTEQDYFSPRSTILSHAVLANVRAIAFRRVLERFQNEVSRFRIVHFDVFRRRAFDEAFATKAFPNWEDGQKYYDMLVAKDQSPFLYQQAALYLAKKKRYREAFRWIDQAIEMSGARIPSIRNSHAVILFRANINAAGSGSSIVKDTLKRSMDILSECYRYDKRKNYHAMRFGEQAVAYWEAYSDGIARDYLATAKKWVAEESKKSPWDRRLRQLLQEIGNALAATA